MKEPTKQELAEFAAQECDFICEGSGIPEKFYCLSDIDAYWRENENISMMFEDSNIAPIAAHLAKRKLEGMGRCYSINNYHAKVECVLTNFASDWRAAGDNEYHALWLAIWRMEQDRLHPLQAEGVGGWAKNQK